MIDFSKITKTVDGYDCHYFGTRESYGTKLHCFGVMTAQGVVEKCYDDQGRRLVWVSCDVQWGVCENDSFAIIKPPKIVEVTRWVALFHDGLGGYRPESYTAEPRGTQGFIDIQQHTFRFEVPNE